MVSAQARRDLLKRVGLGPTPEWSLEHLAQGPTSGEVMQLIYKDMQVQIQASTVRFQAAMYQAMMGFQRLVDGPQFGMPAWVDPKAPW